MRVHTCVYVLSHIVMALHSFSVSAKLIANHLFHMNNLTANQERTVGLEVHVNSGQMVLTILLAKGG